MTDPAVPAPEAQRFDEILKAYGVFFDDPEMRSRLIIDLQQEITREPNCTTNEQPSSSSFLPHPQSDHLS
jgi:hypothetical protein